MKPARLIAIIAMVTVLGLILAVPLMLVGAFSYGAKHMGEFSDSQWEHKGQPVKLGQNTLSTSFDSIGQAGPVDIIWVRDKQPGFVVSGPAQNVALVRYEMNGETLKFGCAKGWTKGLDKVKIVVHGPQPESISMAGSGNVIAKDLSGGDFDFNLAGSGDAILSGKLDSLDVSIAGSGDVMGKELKCTDCSVSIAGSGNIDIDAESKLDVNIAGSGNITYYGDPAVERSVIGSGKIHKG